MKKRIGNRIMASLLVAVLLAGNLSAFAAAATESYPVQPTQAALGEQPTIEIQGNVVKDQFGKLTGFFELALRVKTPVGEPFRELMVALKYNANTMIPVDWNTPGEDGAVVPLDLSSTAKYSVQQPSKKADGVTMSAALTHGRSYAPGEEGQKRNLLYFHAESYKGVSLSELTTLAVIRFQIDPSIQADFVLDANGAPLYNGNPAELTAFIGFADDADAAASPAGQALYYESVDNAFYYTAVTVTEQVNMPDNISPVGQIDAPKTKGTRVLAIDETKSPSSADYYSYLSNLLKEGTDFSLTMVSEESFSKTGLDINKLCVITYMDWDDTIIGTQVVPQNADVRALVNDYVKENFVHTDLENNTNYSSVARIDNYRGKYPASGPALAGTPSGITDGEDFPLTNKLDYVFLKRPMEYDSTAGTWTQETNAGGAPVYDAAYPYTHGWALCASSGAAENTWTTLGSTGELSNYAVNSTTGVASFSYDGTGFNVAEFGAGFDKREIYVKAMYEPGKDLLKGYTYELVGEPYFNKYNELPASAGGAYSVVAQYSRTNSATGGGVVKGVTRMRAPSLRQETTTDLKWESDHTLPNATASEFQTKEKATYTYVPTSGVETVNVEMALSARANKVDFYLIDKYSSNFISGSERSQTYNTKMLDNYAYSEANNAYDTRDGTMGFVFAGTLNSILEKTSKKVMGLEADSFTTYVTYKNINDINLYDQDKSPYTNVTFITKDAANKISAAVQEAYNQRLLGPTENWDDDHNCANLSYHQLQNYILTNTLVSKAAADDLVFPWCRLHQKCIDDGAAGVTDWASLLENAYQYETNTAAKDAVDNMLPSLMVGFGLAKNADGALFTSSDLSDFITYIVAATQAAGTGNYAGLTKKQVQYYILNSSYVDAATAQTAREQEYWWFDVSAKPNNWNTLVSAAKLNYPAALNTAKSAYDTLATSNTAWIQLTHNLAKNEYGDTFDTFEDFKMALKNAVTALSTYSAPTWAQVQVFILTGDIKSATDAQAVSDANYWWYNGGKKVVDLATLLSAVDAYNKGNSAALSSFNYALLYDTSNTEFHFRKSFSGEEYTSAEFSVLIAQLCGIVQANGTSLSWSQIQYYLIHGTYVVEAVADVESNSYYWWKNGMGGRALSITAGTTAANLKSLMEAAYAASVNKNPMAWDDLTADKITTFKLVSDYTTETEFADLPKFDTTSIDTFKSIMEDLVTAATAAGESYKTLTWFQIQYYLLKSPADPYLTAIDSELPTVDEYWWYQFNTDPNAKSPLDQFIEIMEDYIDGAINDAALKSAVVSYFPQMNIYLGTTVANLKDWASSTSLQAAMQTKIVNLAKSLKSRSMTAKENVTWYTLQYYGVTTNVMNGTATVPVTPATAYTYYTNTIHGTWEPTYATEAPVTTLLIMASFSAMLEPSVNTETTTSPDGLTKTTTETFTTQDAATGDTVIATTVTAVTTSTVETESEYITTTVTTTAVTTVTISVLTGQPTVTTTSETVTTTERTPMETASPAPEETTEPDAAMPEETAPTETEEPDITDPAASAETETAAQPETTEETKTETGSEKETAVSQEPAALPPDTGEGLGSATTVSFLWSSPPSGYAGSTLLSGSGLPALSGTWGGTTRSWFYRREGPRWSNLFLAWASPGITVISHAWCAGLDLPLRGGELEPSRRTVT